MDYQKLKYYYTFVLFLVIANSCSLKDSSQIQNEKLKNSNNFSEFFEFAFKNQDSRFCDSACYKMSKLIQNQGFDYLNLIGTINSHSDKIVLTFTEIIINEPYIPFKQQNKLTLLISNKPSVSYWDNKTDFSNIKSLAKEFLTNPQDYPNYPDKILVEIENIGMIEKSVGHIIIQADYLKEHYDKSDWNYLFKAIEQIQTTYNEIWDELSNGLWHKNFNKLDYEKKLAILKVSPYQIELHFDNPLDSIPPPPTKDMLKDIQIIDD
jgi:hypothetical protein